MTDQGHGQTEPEHLRHKIAEREGRAAVCACGLRFPDIFAWGEHYDDVTPGQRR